MPQHTQVGTGDRSEKIKTYNYKDSRVSDHRIKANFDLNKCLEGVWGLMGEPNLCIPLQQMFFCLV